MSDIVERLRGQHWWLNVDGAEAADAFERLQKDKLHWEHQNGLLEAEIERMRRDLDVAIASMAQQRQEIELLRAGNVQWARRNLHEVRGEVAQTINEALLKDNERLRAALWPLARLSIPHKPQGNAGAYSIFHTDIRRAQKLCGDHEQKEVKP